MRKLLVFQHVAFELLGTLHPLLKHRGFRIRYVNFEREPHAQPVVDRYNGLVVLGGPMNCDQTRRFPHLATEIAAIQRAVELGIPVLGICLGAQLLARALGAKVRPNSVKEIGWYPLNTTPAAAKDPLLGLVESGQPIFQWHGDTFEIPRGAVHLASTPSCMNQAFRFGKRAYGFQFHLEVDRALIDRWLNVPVHRRELRALRGTIDPKDIRRQTQAFIEPSVALSEQVFGRFIDLFRLPGRRLAMPSR